MADKQKYRVTVRCGCGKEFKKITTDRRYVDFNQNSSELMELMSKVACPSCKKNDGERRFRLGDGAVEDEDLVEPSPLISVEKYQCDGCSKTNRFYKEKEGDCLSHCHYCGSQDVKYIGHSMSGIVSDKSKQMIKALDVTAEMTMKTYGMSDINMGSNMREGDTCTPKLPPMQQQMADGMFNHNKLPSGANYEQIGRKAIGGAFADPNNPVAALHRSKTKPKFDIREAPTANIKQGAKLSAYDRMVQKGH